MTVSDWIGLGLLIGDAVLTAGCLALAVFLGWWWLLPFALLTGGVGAMVGYELWSDW